MKFEAVRRIATVLAVVGLLVGCATPVPLLQKMKEDQAQRMTLLVEDGPFQYTQPAIIDVQSGAATAGILLFGALAQIAIQERFNSVHADLVAAARARGLAVDHRQAFVEQYVRGLAARGIEAHVVRVPYGPTMIGTNGDRSYVGPVRTELDKLPRDVPTYALRLDAGSCGTTTIRPCIRYGLQPAWNAHGAQAAFSGVTGIEPRQTASATTGVVFQDIDAAKARITEFDAALADTVPRAAEALLLALETAPPAR